MKLGIRAKLIGNLVLAGVLPLALAVITLQTFGYRHQVQQRGGTFRSEARHVAHNVSLIAENQIHTLQEFLDLTDVADQVAQRNAAAVPMSDQALAAELNEIEARWPALAVESPEIQAVLTNGIAARLRQFQFTQPLFAEILVTDDRGRLIAATEKSSDFYQADEAWWQHSSQLKAGEAWLEGLAFDESARVLSLDVCLPVRSRRGDGGNRAEGAIKAVLNVTPLFASIPFLLSDSDAIREVVRGDGQVLLRLLDERFVPRSETISAQVMGELKPDLPGWVVTRWHGDQRQMVGYAPLKLLGVFTETTVAPEAHPLMVIVRSDAKAVLAPVRAQLTVITFAGSLLVLGCVCLGIYFGGQNFIHPLETLRAAARAVAGTAKIGGSGGSDPAARRDQGPSADEIVQRVKAIRTGDEIEALGQDFSTMAGRLLHYQEQLEADVAAKTAEIQKDLAMARDFQEALLPREYPPIPTSARGDDLRLQFHHVYRPASAVGGDFFDVIKLSDHRAGIVVADVMGHGTRSALVTAILRTLIQDAASHADDPGQFLAMLNRHFYSVIQQTGQLVFVSAFYMVIDTQHRSVACASAGHPSPLVVNRVTGAVEPLFTRLRDNPALGLFAQSRHTVFTRELREQELFLLFTDGLVEATNADDEEFGRERLTEVIRHHLDRDLPGLLQEIVKSLTRFAGEQVPPDDICLVGVEAISRPARPKEEHEPEAHRLPHGALGR